MSTFFLILGYLGLLPAQLSVHVPVYNLYQEKGLISLASLSNVILEKRYATSNNVCGLVLDSDGCCYLREVAYAKFLRASEILRAEHPKMKFIIYDAYRSPKVQSKLWEKVKGTPNARYVAYPKCVSMHSLGLALDLTIADSLGKPLDMGTDYDSFTQLAQPRFESQSLHSGALSKAQYENRLLLRSIMKRAGFFQLQSEWWHYEALHQKFAHSHYKVIE